VLLAAGCIFGIIISTQYYISTAHTDLTLYTLSNWPSSVLPSGHSDVEDLRIQDELPKGTPDSPDGTSCNSSACRTLPGASDVLVVLKTGATELFQRIPAQLLTLARCAPNFMVFSDVEQDIGSQHIHSALDSVSDEYKDTHEDFQFYRRLKNAQARHEDLSVIGKGTESGWNLDKWKNIPMLHNVYHTHPKMKWFVFIDADTYLGWTNLLQLLSTLDPEEPLYFGSSYVYGNVTFAQGGTGYVISAAAARAFEETRDEEHVKRWEDITAGACCGDVMLAIAMLDAGVNVTAAWPLVNSDPPWMFEWSERVWCTPPVTWHHVRPDEVQALWEFEMDWAEQNKGQEEVGDNSRSFWKCKDWCGADGIVFRANRHRIYTKTPSNTSSSRSCPLTTELTGITFPATVHS